LISKEDSSLKISNFSKFPVRIHEGQVLGYTHNPMKWFDSARNLTLKELDTASSHALMVKSIGDILSRKPEAPLVNTEGISELEGGPKIAETPPVDTPRVNLLEAVDISKGLTTDQTEKITEV